MNYIRLFEIILDFIHEYGLPKPRSITSYNGREGYVTVSLLIDGRNEAPEEVSGEFLWEHHDNGIVSTEIIFDGVRITVQVFENDEEAA